MLNSTRKTSRAILLSLPLVLLSLPAPEARVCAADTFRPVVRGRRGVVAGGHPLSVEAGMRILQRGGNAVDAGVATILAASVIEFSHFSFGGEVPILVRLKGRPVAVVEGMGQAPRKATREFFVRHAEGQGARRDAGSAPGFLPGSAPSSQASSPPWPSTSGFRTRLEPPNVRVHLGYLC